MNGAQSRRGGRASRGLVLGLAGLLASASWAGCAVRPLAPDPTPRPARPLTAELVRHYRPADAAPPKVQLERVRQVGAIVTWRGTLTRALPEGPRSVAFDYFEHSDGRPRPAILCTPILGGDGTLELGVVASFARAGFQAILVRRNGDVFEKDWTPEDIEGEFRRYLTDRRCIVDWLALRPGVDADRIGAFGISMGGIVTTSLIAVEPRIRAAVTAMAGGDIGRILAETKEPPLVAWREHWEEQQGLAGEDLVGRFRGTMVSDPMRLAPFVDPRRLLVVVSRYDDIVPTRIQRRLRRALGDPPGWEVPCGHYQAIAFLPFLRAKAIAFFRKRLGRPAPILLTGADP